MAWIEYFWKWLLAATPTPIRVIEFVVLLVAIFGLAIRQLRPEWVGRMDKLAWQIPLGLLVAVFVISLAVSSYGLYKQQQQAIADLESQLEVARRQVYPPITTLMMSPFFKDIDIPLGNFGLVNQLLMDKTFDHCRIHGPVVVLLKDNINMSSCTYIGDLEAILIVTTNQRIDGVLAMENCTFVNCTFDRVSFIGQQSLIDKLRADIKIREK